ncbi:MAG: ECF transporter S component, partial [Clostridiaceae bacterium]|nr:ECF transporter S component [Clostridiaceae bacterium]
MKNLFKSPRGLTFLGLMLAITIIMDMTPLGMIPIGAISATIIHIPTIITGVVLGPVAGFIMGTSFGIVSLTHALTRPATILDPLFMNPLVSV